MLGQELDSLADLVRTTPYDFVYIFRQPTQLLDILRRCARLIGLRDWAANVVGYRHTYRFHLLRARTTCKVQRHRCPHPKKFIGQVKLL